MRCSGVRSFQALVMYNGADRRRRKRPSCSSHRQRELAQQLAARRIAVDAPAPVQPDPDASFCIDDGSVGIAIGLSHARKDTSRRQRAIRGKVERVDHTLQRVDVIERSSVRTRRRPIRDHVTVVAAVQPRRIEAIQRARRADFIVVHRTEPQPAGSVDVRIVESIARTIGIDEREQPELAAVGPEDVEPALQAADEATAAHSCDETDFLPALARSVSCAWLHHGDELGAP